MDFNDSPAEAEFRNEVYQWLSGNAELKADKDTLSNNRRTATDEVAALAKAKEWQAKKADKGYAQITWPEAWGGRGGTPIQQVIYNQEEAKFDVPTGFFDIGLGMCIPTVMTYCQDETAKGFVGPALRGETVWCQLFSEPSAGSDVAGLRTKAEKDGDEWVINGQKVWTSGAHYSDYGILLTRTDPDVPKHKGLTMFWIDMKDAAVECRPIKQMSGTANFNEVYFNDLRVKDDQRIGEVGNGWAVALTTLMNERLAVGGGQGGAGASVSDLIALARDTETEAGNALQESAVRERIADWHVRLQGLKFTTYRTLTALSKGQTPGPEASIGKVVAAGNGQDLADFAMDLQDMGGIANDESAPMQRLFQQSFMMLPGLRIAGGTDEILRNIIAERVLGLPGDIRVDRKVAFKDVPTGK